MCFTDENTASLPISWPCWMPLEFHLLLFRVHYMPAKYVRRTLIHCIVSIYALPFDGSYRHIPIDRVMREAEAPHREDAARTAEREKQYLYNTCTVQ